MMKQWLLGVTASAALAMLLVMLLAASWATLPLNGGRTAQPSTFVPPIEVGSTYGFGVSGTNVIGKVVQEPRDGWLQVEVQEGDATRLVWLNLQHVSSIMPDPPQENKGGAAPCRPGSV
jgi:hypothetical protein